jgi:zinc transport system substrate-binding protein
MNKRRLILTISILLAITIGFYFFFSRQKPPVSEKMQVTASFYPLAEFASRIGGEKASVLNLVPAGMEPHDFEPTPQNMVTVSKSRLFIYNGAGFEPWLAGILSQLNSSTTTINSSENVNLINSKAGELDPHIWLDPVLAQTQAQNILSGYKLIDSTNEEFYTDNAAILTKELELLHKEFETRLSSCQNDTIITSHSAFSYLAKRYGFKIVSIAGLSPEQEPSAQQLANIVDLVRQNKIQYVFFESLSSPKLAETLAHETGAKTLSLNPLEGLTEEELAEKKDYFTIQRENLTNLSKALQCN